MGTDRRHLSFVLATALASFLMAGAGATPALAVNADACGVVTQHTIAKAFELADTVEHHAVLRDSGNLAGVIHDRCQAYAYRGPKPTTSAQRRAGLLAGTGAEITIDVWATDTGPSAGAWLANFGKKLEALRSQAKAQFLEGPLEGSTYDPPRFGAEASIGYQGHAGATTKVRALWWERSTGTLILVNAAEAKSKPLRASLRSLMADVVPGVLF